MAEVFLIMYAASYFPAVQASRNAYHGPTTGPTSGVSGPNGLNRLAEVVTVQAVVNANSKIGT
jgi:hypothetical protein